MADLKLPAVLTMSQARETLARLETKLNTATASATAATPATASITAAVVMDASALQTLDSAALAVLLQCRRLALQSGRTFQITGAAPKLRQLAQLYGVDSLLELA